MIVRENVCLAAYCLLLPSPQLGELGLFHRQGGQQAETVGEEAVKQKKLYIHSSLKEENILLLSHQDKTVLKLSCLEIPWATACIGVPTSIKGP